MYIKIAECIIIKLPKYYLHIVQDISKVISHRDILIHYYIISRLRYFKQKHKFIK